MLNREKVDCVCEETVIENDIGIEVDGVCVTCTKCDHSVESYGLSDKSIKRCCVLLNEECPYGEDNFYCVD